MPVPGILFTCEPINFYGLYTAKNLCYSGDNLRTFRGLASEVNIANAQRREKKFDDC